MLGYITRSVPFSLVWVISVTVMTVLLFHCKLMFSESRSNRRTFVHKDADLLPTIVVGRDKVEQITHKQSVIQQSVMQRQSVKRQTVTSRQSATQESLEHTTTARSRILDKITTSSEDHPSSDDNKADMPSNTMLFLFSTWINKTGKEHVRKSILGTWRQWHPSIVPVLLTDDIQLQTEAEEYGWEVRAVSETGCGNSSIPTLRGMFKNVITEFKGKATLFGFSNGDLLFDDSLVHTMKSLLNKEAEVIRTRPVMVLMKRLNVRVPDKLTVTNISLVEELGARGRYPGEGSSDIFITNHLFPWDKVPEIVIGRIGFGMWIVAFARANNVTLYDVTKTVTVVHMTTHEGIFESHKSSNAWCNHKLVNSLKLKPRSYLCGYIDCAGKRSMYGDDGTVQFVDVDTKTMMKGCHVCD